MTFPGVRFSIDSFWRALGFALISALMCSCGQKTDPTPGTMASFENQPQDRYEWNLKTLVGAYEQAGFSDPKWDEPAKHALTAFATNRAGPMVSPATIDSIRTNSAAAVLAGCTDPMVGYLNFRFSERGERDHKWVADALCEAALKMKASSYPAVRKFYATRRAIQAYYHYYGSKEHTEILHEIGGPDFYIPEILADPTIPIEEAYDVCRENLLAYGGSDKRRYEELLNRMERRLVERWPKDHRPYLLAGQGHIELAWKCRGTGYSETVKTEGWMGFEEHLAAAEQALNRAWELNQQDINIPRKMLTVELGQGQGRDRMELWFERAMALDTNCYHACFDKLYYLEPKWHGSEDDLLVFGWQCVQSRKWGGTIPLILVDAHDKINAYLEGAEKTNYWRRSEVWLDLEAAFERLLELNPKWTGYYHNYARYAYRCERWDKLNELLPRFASTNFDYFGGEAEFQRMAKEAQAHDGKAKPVQLDIGTELRRLLIQLSARGKEPPVREEDVAKELKQLDDLAVRCAGTNREDAAKVLCVKADLYAGTLENLPKAKEVLVRVKQSFPETRAAQEADEIAAAFELMVQKREAQRALAPGRPFPILEESDLNGNKLSATACRGKVVLVDFWATWCGSCIAELPNVQKTYNRFHSQGFEVIGVSLDQDKEELTHFIKEKKIPWPQYYDGGGWTNKLAVKFGIDALPATFLLDQEGTIVSRNIRGEALARAVEKALNRSAKGR